MNCFKLFISVFILSVISQYNKFPGQNASFDSLMQVVKNNNNVYNISKYLPDTESFN